MSDIFRDVDDALQREKAQKFWKEYGPTLVLAAIVMIIATAATTGYKTWDSRRDRQETAELITAIQDKDMAAALTKAAEDTRSGHRAVALLAAGAKYAGDKNFTKAAETYELAAKNGDHALSDLAVILSIRSTMLAKPDDSSSYPAAAGRLEKIANDKSSPFQLQAKLDGALLYGSGLKDYKKALALLEGFDGADVPDSLKEKADALKHVYASESGVATPEGEAKP